MLVSHNNWKIQISDFILEPIHRGAKQMSGKDGGWRCKVQTFIVATMQIWRTCKPDRGGYPMKPLKLQLTRFQCGDWFQPNMQCVDCNPCSVLVDSCILLAYELCILSNILCMTRFICTGQEHINHIYGIIKMKSARKLSRSFL